jgi:Ca-activated chloride channel family protein
MPLPRPIKNSLLPLLLAFATQKVCAQLAPADDFFNNGARLYISNNIPQAKDAVEMGLKLYPDDDKLKKLEELLKQQQQSQSSQSQQNQQQQQSQSQQNSKSQQSQQQNQQQSQQNSQDQKKSDEQKQNQADQKKDEQQKQAEEQKSNGEKNENQNGDNQAVAAQMTPEEAKRLLDAQKGDEQVLQMKPKDKPENQNRPVKDW